MTRQSSWQTRLKLKDLSTYRLHLKRSSIFPVPEMDRSIARETTEALENERKTWLIGDT